MTTFHLTRRSTLQSIVLIVSMLVSVLVTITPVSASSSNSLPTGDDAVVTKVVDGDTIEVKIGDTAFTIAYLASTAPKGRPGQTPECFAKEAKAFNIKLVAGKTLRLERDTSDFDADGRLLRYAYLPDGRMVNRLLLEQGYATYAPRKTDTRYAAVFAAAQEQAQAKKVGRWAKCEPPKTDTTNTAAVAVKSAPAPAYPSVSASYSSDAWHSTDYAKGSCGSLVSNQPYKVTGKSADGSWWQIEWPGDVCWVKVVLVEFKGDPANIPIIDSPAPEPPTAVPQTIVAEPAPQPSGGGRTGAICNDGTSSAATGRGACSHHHGVNHWLP